MNDHGNIGETRELAARQRRSPAMISYASATPAMVRTTTG